jgi:hypothetical protein
MSQLYGEYRSSMENTAAVWRIPKLYGDCPMGFRRKHPHCDRRRSHTGTIYRAGPVPLPAPNAMKGCAANKRSAVE